MPWKVRSVMRERLAFMEAWLRGGRSRAEVCREFGISRKTGYKLAARFAKDGEEGLSDRSHRPHSCPHGMSAGMRALILSERGKHATWGPRKLLWELARQGVCGAPSRSAAARVLKGAGVAAPRKRRLSGSPSPQLVLAERPNDVWCMDFKGFFSVGSGERCDPLTLLDAHSRFLFLCEGLFGSTGFDAVKPVLERAFVRFGLPRFILTDNGPPFASCAVGGISRLAVWLIKLGITPLRIEPGKPQQNGRLERFHRTLKAETARPPSATPLLQRERFAAFLLEYNEGRPHEALNDETPASVYTKSARAYDAALGSAALEYGEGVVARRVSRAGTIFWQKERLFISTSLIGETIGLRLYEREALATVLLGDYEVGLLNLRTGRIGPVPAEVKLVSIRGAGDRDERLCATAVTIDEGKQQKFIKKAQSREAEADLSLCGSAVLEKTGGSRTGQEPPVTADPGSGAQVASLRSPILLAGCESA
ncbi:hypothetical protein BH09SUM1_BH09SUM1_19120 [soil metagenome]